MRMTVSSADNTPCPGSFVSVVVPVYQGAATLGELVARLEPVLARAAERFEIILVDDGSRDASWPRIEELAKRYASVRGLGLMRNYGQHNALLCGICESRGDTIVTMDDDLQHPPEELPKLLARLQEGFDVVYGRPERLPHGFYRNLASRVTKLVLSRAMGAEAAESISAFRAFRGDIRPALMEHRGPSPCLDVLLSWCTNRFAAVAVEHRPRAAGESNYGPFKLAAHAMNMMTGYSTMPLRLASVLGIVMSAFGAVALAYVLLRYMISGAVVPGFAFLASITALFSGAQLFGIGVMGEYLARMHLRILDRPMFVVRSRTGGRADQEGNVP